MTSEYGEEWNSKTSWIQLLGFIIMVFGAFTYYKVIRLPFFRYDDEPPARHAAAPNPAPRPRRRSRRRRRGCASQAGGGGVARGACAGPRHLDARLKRRAVSRLAAAVARWVCHVCLTM